jgi:hypothetical protein
MRRDLVIELSAASSSIDHDRALAKARFEVAGVVSLLRLSTRVV